MPTPWTELRVALDPIARRFNHYTAYRIREAERIGTTGRDVASTREYLRQQGYEPQYLSAAKRHPDTGQAHDISYRRVPESHPPAADGRDVAEKFTPEECQFHVHAFATGGQVELFSHYEARPDFFSPTWDVARLRTHYRPVYGEEYLRGVTRLEV